MTAYLLLAFFLWWGLGYLVFYFRYQHRDVVNELRSNLKDANKEVHSLWQDLEEHLQQNLILKEKMTDFLQKNDDLSKVVWELSKYYYHIKKAAQKTDELSTYLKHPDTDIEEKMKPYLWYESNKDRQQTSSEKSFF